MWFNGTGTQYVVFYDNETYADDEQTFQYYSQLLRHRPDIRGFGRWHNVPGPRHQHDPLQHGHCHGRS